MASKLTSSRKFVGYMLAEASWKLLIAGGLYVEQVRGMSPAGWTALWLMVGTAGFLEVAFILGQAYVDRYLGLVKSLGPRDGEPTDTEASGPG